MVGGAELGSARMRQNGLRSATNHREPLQKFQREINSQLLNRDSSLSGLELHGAGSDRKNSESNFRVRKMKIQRINS
jgi:hypothetical protein